MTTTGFSAGGASQKRLASALLVVLGAAVFLLAPLSASAQVPLLTAANFGALAGSTVTNTGLTNVTGDVGVSPGTAITGFPPGTAPAFHSNNAVAIQAQADLTAGYNTAAGTACNVDLTGQDLGGLTLTPNVYCFATSAGLTGILRLDFQGNPNANFLFQIGSTLTTASGSAILGVNTGGAGCMPNVNFQVGSSATLGTSSDFAGNILALTSITLTTLARLRGRALARNGAVTLDSNTVGGCPFAFAVAGGPGAGAGIVNVPTLQEWNLILLAILLACGGGWYASRRKKRI